MKLSRRGFFLSVAAMPAFVMDWPVKMLLDSYNIAATLFSKEQVHLKGNSLNKPGFCFIQTIECPRMMTYKEYLADSASWVDWIRLDKFVLDSLKSGELIEIDFKYDGKKSISKMYFESEHTFQVWSKKVDDGQYFLEDGPYANEANNYKLDLELKNLV